MLDDIFSDVNCDFLLISEHWQEKVNINILKLRNFTLCTSYCRVTMKHGGVAIYKNDNYIHDISVVNIESLNVEGIFECCCIRIPTEGMTIAACYRPPSGDFDLFLQVFNEFLNYLSTMSGRIIIGGDFNIDLLVHSDSSMFFRDSIACFNFQSVISLPTRVTSTSRTCIDNFLINFDDGFSTSLKDFFVSDHCAILIDVKSSISEKKT